MIVIFRVAVLLYLHPAAPAEQVWYAASAQTERVPATITLAQAYEESRYDPTVVSPKGFCGVLQLKLRGAACLDVELSYRESVKHLEQWLDFCRGRMPCALAGYGAGVKAARGHYPNGRGERYAKRVLRRARWR